MVERGRGEVTRGREKVGGGRSNGSRDKVAEREEGGRAKMIATEKN